MIWFKTVNQKNIPVDAEPVKRLVIVGETLDGKHTVKMMDTYMPHHATCPQGKEWRKK
jgi:hypothetical protein